MINRHFFFDYAKRHLFKSRLSQKQVDGLNVILDAWEASYARKDDRWLAYALSTAHHETDARMHPIHEYEARATSSRCTTSTAAAPRRR
jgi:putative chitinase